MRRLLPLVAAVTLVAAVLAGSAAAGSGSSQSGVRVVEAKGPNFPVRTFVITLPQGSKLSIRDITITENGTPVIEPSLTPASKASRKTFGVVLALDTSWSMRGKPLAAAIAAENAFVAQRNPNEQVGAINFNRETTPVLPLTASAEKITAGLATKPQIATGTHIYDAVGEAEAMLRKAHINSGSIVVLSDGADTGSTKTIYQVTKAARQSHMHIYTIGLVDKTYKPSTLKGLAKEGGGQYAEAQAQALSPLYGRLSQVLSNEYLLQYKSLAGPDAKVKVSVTVNGVGSSDTQYQTPAIPVHSAVSAPYKQSLGSRVWGSVITMILLALLAAGAVALLAIVLFQPQKSNLPTRMAEFVSIRDLQRDKGGATAAAAAAAAAAGPDGQHKSRWQRFEEMLEIADIKASPETIVAGTFAATGLTFLLIYTGTGSLGWALLAFAVPYIVREWVLRTLKRRRDKFAEQLPDALQVVASALRSGHSFAGALAVVVESGSEPMKSELQRVVADEQLGVPIQDSLGVVAERMASRDVEQLALVAELQRESGGNAAEVIDRVAETVRERFDLKRLIRTLTTQGRMSRWIVSALPVFIIIFLRIINPGYLHPLLATTGGRVVFGLAAAWAILGSLLIKRIVEIEV